MDQLLVKQEEEILDNLSQDNSIENRHSSLEDDELFREMLRREQNENLTRDLGLLTEMGFSIKLINKVYVFLRPRTIDQAILLMTEIDGIYQHNFYYSHKGNKCFICGYEEKFHFDYSGIPEMERSDMKDKETLSKPKIEKKEDSVISIEGDNECVVCYDNVPLEESQGSHLSCGHICCDSCWFEYLKAQIEEAKVSKITCVDYDCKVILEKSFIEKRIEKSPSLIQKYKKFLQKAEIIDNPKKKFCPEPNCESFLEQTNKKVKYLKCQAGHQYCFICLKHWHGKKPCEDETDKDFQLWKKNKTLKRCPNCKMYTEKNEGCNHMTCAECQYQWCWLCEKKYSLSHFTSGTCKGLQFARVNYLKDVKENMRENVREDEQPWFVRADEDTTCCCVSCCGNLYDWFAGLDIFNGSVPKKFCLFMPLMILFGAPVCTFEFLLPFLEELPGEGFCTQFLLYIFTIILVLSNFICYQILFTCSFLVVTLPVFFYWPWVNKLIRFFIQKVYYGIENFGYS